MNRKITSKWRCGKTDLNYTLNLTANGKLESQWIKGKGNKKHIHTHTLNNIKYRTKNKEPLSIF